MKLNKLPLNVIGLNRVGLNQIGSPSRRANTSDRPYIDPEVLASLVAVCICDGKSNNDPDRAVIKNLVDPDNPFIISNAAFKLNSGYGKYEVDFTIFNDITDCTIIGNKIINHSEVLFKAQYNYEIKRIDVESFNAKVENITKGYIGYTYRDNNGIEKSVSFTPETIKANNGIITLPKSYNTLENSTGVLGGLYGYGVDKGTIITQIPSHQGAFVTDGKDDLITSTKTVKEMLGGSNEVTVVSMVHQIGLSSLTTINNIRSESAAHLVCRNVCSSAGKTGIYGYSRQINTNNPPTLINNILGDKKDYTTEGNSALDPTDKFFVQGYKYSGTISEVSPIAYYWTFISNKTLTTDQINQVISYFNLDKHVKPDIIYDTIRQGITNENHASFNDELVDFSGNGHNMKIYNSAWKLGSGIGKYEADYSTWTKVDGVITTPTGFKIVGQISSTWWLLFLYNTIVPAHKIKVSGIPAGGKLVYDVTTNLENGINELPEMEATSARGFTINLGNTQFSDWIGLSVEQIPDYEGALVSDGIDDYGKVENLPIYKDYTVVADRAWTNDLVKAQCLTSKLNGDNFGSFSFELIENGFSSYSFGISNKGVITIDSNKKISYQSKYVYNSSPIISGNNVDGKDLFLFRNRDSYPYYAEAAIWSYILFPYSLSEFLLERQLKRYKLGTLYSDMVEFRPIVKSNREYSSISYSVNPGEYISVDSMVTITVTLSNTSDKLMEVSCNAISDISVSGDNGVYEITGKIVKSPQKIGIAIESDV